LVITRLCRELGMMVVFRRKTIDLLLREALKAAVLQSTFKKGTTTTQGRCWWGDRLIERKICKLIWLYWRSKRLQFLLMKYLLIVQNKFCY